VLGSELELRTLEGRRAVRRGDYLLTLQALQAEPD
jgi:hypothetical protein